MNLFYKVHHRKPSFYERHTRVYPATNSIILSRDSICVDWHGVIHGLLLIFFQAWSVWTSTYPHCSPLEDPRDVAIADSCWQWSGPGRWERQNPPVCCGQFPIHRPLQGRLALPGRNCASPLVPFQWIPFPSIHIIILHQHQWFVDAGHVLVNRLCKNLNDCKCICVMKGVVFLPY